MERSPQNIETASCTWERVSEESFTFHPASRQRINFVHSPSAAEIIPRRRTTPVLRYIDVPTADRVLMEVESVGLDGYIA